MECPRPTRPVDANGEAIRSTGPQEQSPRRSPSALSHAKASAAMPRTAARYVRPTFAMGARVECLGQGIRAHSNRAVPRIRADRVCRASYEFLQSFTQPLEGPLISG